MSEKICLKVDFNQEEVKNEVIEVLASNLKEDPARDDLKVTLKESLALASKGTKLKNGPANELLFCILRSLSLISIEADNPATVGDESDGEVDEDPEKVEETDDEDEDESMSQILKKAKQRADMSGKKIPQKTGKQDKRKEEQADSKKKGRDVPICRFYANGKCRFGPDCRSQHPKICQKYRLNGELKTDPKGCDGRCGSYHPNGCRNSLRNKTCTYKECKFFHLSGTKTIERNQINRESLNRGDDKRHGFQQGKSQGTGKAGQKKITNNANNQTSTRNRFGVLDDNQSESRHETQQVFQKEKSKLDSTLERIMRELTDIRTWQHLRTEPGQQFGVQPIPRTQAPSMGLTPHMHIPVVAQPGGAWSTQDQHAAWHSQDQNAIWSAQGSY
jgi:hypothetical protein